MAVDEIQFSNEMIRRIIVWQKDESALDRRLEEIESQVRRRLKIQPSMGTRTELSHSQRAHHLHRLLYARLNGRPERLDQKS